MASLGRVSSLTSGLFTKAGVVPSVPVRGARSSLSIPYSQCKNCDRKKEDDDFWKEESSMASMHAGTSKCEESEAVEPEKYALDTTISSASTIDPLGSSSTPKHASMRVGKSLPWHSLLSFLKPSHNIQPIRYNSCDTAQCNSPKCGTQKDECDLSQKNDDCKPRITTIDCPLTCVKTRKTSPPCEIPVQKRWRCCDKSMCLPCCCPVEKPLRCKIFDITLNTCPRKTYRIAAYSECNKRYGRKQYKKECCYHKRICYAGNIADREIKPLLHIKDRQALVLGFGIKALCDTPC